MGEKFILIASSQTKIKWSNYLHDVASYTISYMHQSITSYVIITMGQIIMDDAQLMDHEIVSIL